MATSGWLGNRVIHSWGSAYSRFESDVYINSIQRNSTNIRVRGTIYLTCRTNGRYCWYTWPIATSANWNQLGNIKPSTGNTYIQNKQWSKSFDITINCSNTATSATLEIRFSDSNMGTKQQNYTLYFDRYASGPSGMTISASYTPYRTITSSCSGINWGQGYSSRKLICDATWTYQGRTETVNLGTWTDGATSKTVTKTDFVFPAENLAVNVKWTAQTNINSISAGKQLTVNKTYPEPILSNAVVSAESTGPYKVRASISGVDFSYNYSKRVISCYIDYTLDGVSYSNKIGEITDGSTSLTVEKDASQETNPWETIPDDNEATIRFVVDNGNGISEKSCSIYCESQYEAYVVGRVPVEEQETNTAEGNSIQISDADNAPLVDYEILGNTTQQTYTGKNLLNTHGTIDADSLTGSGVSYTINADGTISTSGSNTGAYKSIRFLLTLPAGTYKFSGCPSGGTTSGYSFCVEPRGDSTLQLFDTGNGNEFTLTEQKTIRAYPVRIGVDTGVNMNGKVFKPMITVSTASQDYEPYVGGTASPNPDYPQTVQTVTGENTVKIRGKNLLKLTQQASTSNGITATLTDGIIKYSGTASTNWANIAARTYNSIPAGDYMLSMQETFATNYAYALSVTYTDNTTATFECWKSVSNKRTVTLAKDVASYYVYLTGLASGTSYSGTISLMLESGSTATTPFEPYQEQSYEINLGKNLFDKDNANTINAFINGGTRVIDGSSPNLSVYMPCEANTTYTISKVADNVFRAGTTTTTPASGVAVSDYTDNASSTTITLTTSSTAKYLVVFVRNGSSSHTQAEIFASLQIEKGSQATSYSAYFTPIELCKIDDYQDYIYKDGNDWKIHKAIGKYVYNNDLTQNGISSGVVAMITPTLNITASLDYNVGTFYSNMFTPTVINNTGIRGTTSASKIRVQMSTSYTDSYDGFKALCAANNLTIYYPLATTTNTTITNSTLIEQLEAVLSSHTYKNITNIMLIPASTLSGTLDIEYYTKYNDYSPAILSANGKNGTGQFKQIRRVITK